MLQHPQKENKLKNQISQPFIPSSATLTQLSSTTCKTYPHPHTTTHPYSVSAERTYAVSCFQYFRGSGRIRQVPRYGGACHRNNDTRSAQPLRPTHTHQPLFSFSREDLSSVLLSAIAVELGRQVVLLDGYGEVYHSNNKARWVATTKAPPQLIHEKYSKKLLIAGIASSNSHRAILFSMTGVTIV